MAGSTSAIQTDTQDVGLVHGEEFTGHQNIGNENYILAQMLHPSLALALDCIDQVQRYILEIHSPFAKQFIIRLLEQCHHAGGNRIDGPLGADQIGGDIRFDLLSILRILKHKQMRLQNVPRLLGDIACIVLLQCVFRSL